MPASRGNGLSVLGAKAGLTWWLFRRYFRRKLNGLQVWDKLPRFLFVS